ncbi:potassium-transporting ATPase subunit KdpA [Hydrogenovibrio sp. 3SP14C1]|uniref:potassium-transporting ATPase subunit KdpA n=1 Tax=Hydrogenovibrio sp. 3SP14C1 TaxID=3038774 RepID=UPI0024170296|nr:potassium-transporting ATPase subunit KdpA [Hydrogenovibrio sp. 3SP14C1]MDG4813259.1 potassium-transporting ATPase subunit KdpA [Hydrogenovibrio sp. 3SP14C1]
MNEVILIYLVTLLLAWPLGLYIARIYQTGSAPLDRVFLPIEKGVYKLMGVNPNVDMHWKHYFKILIIFHAFLALVVFLILRFQGHLFLNPDQIPNMSWDLALHTALSFLGNADQQHYSGQAQLSHLAQGTGLVTMQFVAPAAGIAILFAILRVLFKTKENVEQGLVGNFYQDMIRAIVRLLIPLAFILSVILTSQGVPSSYQAAAQVETLESSEEQAIPLGPVSPMVAIKQLGTNGGGWYGANSAVPLENPTAISNFFEAMAIMLIPMALVFALGYFSGRKKLATVVMGVMLSLSVVSSSLAIYSENQPNAATAEWSHQANMEGKEVRIGETATALWGAWATQTGNGSVNGMHDSFNPIGGLVVMSNMLVGAIFGGIGFGLVLFLAYMMLAAFLGSLLIGRTASFMNKPLEGHEMKLLAMVFMLQPFVLLVFSGLTLAMPALSGISNPGYHGVTQVIYEYTSAFATNGSGFEGLGDDSVWWNLTTAVTILLGRFVPMFLVLATVVSLVSKKATPSTRESLQIETPTFALVIILLIAFAFLSYLPFIVFGPIAEWVSLINH